MQLGSLQPVGSFLLRDPLFDQTSRIIFSGELGEVKYSDHGFTRSNLNPQPVRAIV